MFKIRILINKAKEEIVIRNFDITEEEIKNNLKYRRVLDNCMKRTEGNIDNIKNYINRYSNWPELIIERHKIYIRKLIKNNYDINKLSFKSGLSKQTLLSVFLRIESQFEIYEYDQKEMLRRVELKKQKILSKINPDTGNKNKDKEIQRQLKVIYNNIELLPEYLNKVVKLLLQGKTIDDIISITNKNKKYLISSIIGTSKPRRPSEMGIEKLVQKEIKKREA